MVQLRKSNTWSKVLFVRGNFEMTLREVVLSIGIFLLFIITGFSISGAMNKSGIKEMDTIAKAMTVENDEAAFNAVVSIDNIDCIAFGTLTADQTVTFSELTGEYFYIERVTEEYTRHTRPATRKVGKTTITVQQPYHSWDTVEREVKVSNSFEFLGQHINTLLLESLPDKRLNLDGNIVSTYKNKLSCDYIYLDGKLSHSSGDKRYYYVYVPKSYTKTLLLSIQNGSIKPMGSGSKIQTTELSPKEYVNNKIKSISSGKIIFWIIWLSMTIGIVVVFIAADNKWLNSNEE